MHPQTGIPQKKRADGSLTDQKFVKAWVSHVAAINCLFAEYDVKDFGSKDAIYTHLKTLPLAPSVIIDSGGGLHCYWLLATTVTVTDANRDNIKRLQYAWVELVGSDDDAKDLARVLRVPGTQNRKEKYAPNFPTVAIVEADYTRLYSLEEFERLTEHLRQEKQRTPYTGSHSVTDDIVTAAESIKRLSIGRRETYQEWMNVGFSLKGLGSAGLQLWDEWSRGSAKYTEGACEAKWDKMTESGLGLGSLIKWANDDDPAGKRVYTNGATNGHATYTNGHNKPEQQPMEEKRQPPPIEPGAGEKADAKPTKKPAGKPTPDPDTEDKSKGQMWLGALRSLGYTFRLNVLEDMVEVDGKRLDDIMRSRIHIDMVSMGVSKTYVDDCINIVAGENSYHPVKAYLNNLVWDGTDLLDQLLSCIQGNDKEVTFPDGTKHRLFRLLMARWLLGCVARALDGDNETAFKHQTPMLVIIGKQGLGKSSFVRWLVSGIGYEYHRESPINPHSAEDIRSMVTKWIWEVSELGSSLRRGDRDALKGFITQEWHTYRKPWGKASITKPTLCNFVGTINPETGFLDDPTGHRRFLPVHITSFNRDYDTIDVNQMWAQLVHMYRNGVSPELSDVERSALEDSYSEHEIENPLQTYLQMYFTIAPGDDSLRCFTADIIQRLRMFGININNNPKVAGKEINDALAPLGLTRTKISIDGVKGMGWIGIDENRKAPPIPSRF